jgi:hypothetical protein
MDVFFFKDVFLGWFIETVTALIEKPIAPELC